MGAYGLIRSSSTTRFPARLLDHETLKACLWRIAPVCPAKKCITEILNDVARSAGSCMDRHRRTPAYTENVVIRKKNLTLMTTRGCTRLVAIDGGGNKPCETFIYTSGFNAGRRILTTPCFKPFQGRKTSSCKPRRDVGKMVCRNQRVEPLAFSSTQRLSSHSGTTQGLSAIHFGEARAE